MRPSKTNAITKGNIAINPLTSAITNAITTNIANITNNVNMLFPPFIYDSIIKKDFRAISTS